MRVRLATLADAEAIRAIYNPEVLGSTVTFDLVPRTLEDQEQWLDEHSGAHPALVADDNGVDRGLRIAHRVQAAAGVPHDASRTRSTSIRDYRAKASARLMLEALVDLATDHGFHAVFARIVGGHEASITLHQQCGFASSAPNAKSAASSTSGSTSS